MGHPEKLIMKTIKRHNYFYLSNHFSEAPNLNFWPKTLVGDKANGLISIPNELVPHFIVISTDAYRDCQINNMHNPSLLKKIMEKDKSIKQFADYKKEKSINHVIIRSSAFSESLFERGKYESKVCDFSDATIIATVIFLWNQYKLQYSDSKLISEKALALIMQPYIHSVSSGHLSNERRVSRNITEWTLEFDEKGTNRQRNIKRFRINNIKQDSDKIEPFCTDKVELVDKLRRISTIESVNNNRVHIEWVWDGKRIWIVQRDVDIVNKGSVPGSAFVFPKSQSKSLNLRVFRDIENVKGQWQKIECLKVFNACKLPLPKVQILEDTTVFTKLFNNEVPQEFKNDLEQLMQLPIVIRTDVSKSSDYNSLLLPRTDTLKSLDDGVEFIKDKVRYFIGLGLETDKFCFIIHTFIVSRSSALSLSKPKFSRIKIDSTWGIADSLLYFPHDSYEVDLLDNSIKKHIRCKSQYVDIKDDGEWITKNSGIPWDWKESINKEVALRISNYSTKIADHLNCPVATMFFIGMNSKTGHPSCLPWYFTREVNIDYSHESSEFMFSTKRIYIENEWDLTKHQRVDMSNTGGYKYFIHLKPEPRLIRSNDFIKRVADFALENNLHIELEGSILSHIYYILFRKGVKVRCIDDFRPAIKKTKYGKLVRDLIPVEIESHGEFAKIIEFSIDDLLPLLKSKAIEEAFELFWESDPVKVFEELADLLEVIKSICYTYNRNFDELLNVVATKRQERGGFEKGIVLLETGNTPILNPRTNSNILLENYDSYKRQKTSTVLFNLGEINTPKLHGNNIFCSLIPPTFILGKKFKIPFEEIHFCLVIEYNNKNIVVSLEPLETFNDSNQLNLFDD